jgi:hypothetical protein
MQIGSVQYAHSLSPFLFFWKTKQNGLIFALKNCIIFLRYLYRVDTNTILLYTISFIKSRKARRAKEIF